MSTLTYDDALARLFKVYESIPGQQASALCPAHNDHDKSLSVGKGADGKLLLKCHAGCDYGRFWLRWRESEPSPLRLDRTVTHPSASSGVPGHREKRDMSGGHRISSTTRPAISVASITGPTSSMLRGDPTSVCGGTHEMRNEIEVRMRERRKLAVEQG